MRGLFYKKKMVKGIVVTFVSLLFMYLAISFYFMNRFYFGSQVNSISVAGKTVEEVNKELSNKVKNYKIKIIGRNNTEEIEGEDFKIEYHLQSKIKKLKEDQNSFSWIASLFSDNNSEVVGMISFNEDLLKQCIDNLSFFKEEIIEPQNADFKYNKYEYEIIPEVKGTKINKDIFIEKLKEAILNGDYILDLDKDGCYIEPEYTINSKNTLNLKENLDKYVGTSITYEFAGTKEVLDGDIINKWLCIDEDYNIEINEEEIEIYVDDLAKKYNTVGASRDFVTSYGSTVNIIGGNYGCAIDKEAEAEKVIEAIHKGEVITKKPEFYQTAYCNEGNEIGNTYVEVSLYNQHIWFYKEGKLLVEGDIVTGNISSGCATPAGTYRLNYKLRDTYLRGEGYETFVSFWMPFNGGIGIHDATWRGAFGGNIYQNGGSHGCVNAPYYVAEVIYNNIEPGMPIVCY